jgi:hypothetical protein
VRGPPGSCRREGEPEDGGRGYGEADGMRPDAGGRQADASPRPDHPTLQVPADVRRQISRVAVAPLRLLRQRPEHDGIEVATQAAPQLVQTALRAAATAAASPARHAAVDGGSGRVSHTRCSIGCPVRSASAYG